jgi:acyl-CoA thioester hydrolase
MTTSPAQAHLKHPYIHRVCYSDTDAAGFVYHGRYLEIFERSRAEWLAQRGLSPTKLINELGIVMPVRELTMNFYKPGRLDDILHIDQIIEHRGRTQVSVKQTAQRKAPDSDELQVIASALLHIVCVDTVTLKPKAWPDGIFTAEE